MREIDLRDVPARELLGTALAAYSELPRGDEVALLVSSFDAGFRMGLVEAGAKHRTEQPTERARHDHPLSEPEKVRDASLRAS
jgi:hypothetical protein